MLAVSPLRSIRDENQGEMEECFHDEFCELSEGNLLESINFDDLFVGITVDGDDVLPDLEVDSEMFAEFSVSGGEESEMTSSVQNNCGKVENNNNIVSLEKKLEDEDKSFQDNSGHGSGSNSGSSNRGEEIVSKSDESVVVNPVPIKDGGKGRNKSLSQSNNTQGKRKVKVDWTPELHRRFVQAVEQLGVDKAVPSRILEIMGIDCLTRHNIASHLQKYRSHRKHLLAREAEAANWSQKRQLYGVRGGGGRGGKREVSPWLAPTPTLGFPPLSPVHHFRPLHVWGHPSMDPNNYRHMWPNKHLPHSPTAPQPLSWAPPVAPPPPPLDLSSFWHAHHQRAPNALNPGTPYFPQPLTTTRFGSSPVPGIPPHAMYKPDPGIGIPGPKPLFDFHPSNETIDAAIGDVLSKPWLPLPLGLKAPALDCVLGELHRQGIQNIPPSSS